MLDTLQRAALIIRVLDLSHLDDLFLLQDLDGVEAAVVPRLHEVHAAEAAGAQGALQREVVERVLALGLALRRLRLPATLVLVRVFLQRLVFALSPLLQPLLLGGVGRGVAVDGGV